MSRVLVLSKPSSSRRCLQSFFRSRSERSSSCGRAAVRRWYTATATVTAPSSRYGSARSPSSRSQHSKWSPTSASPTSAEETEYLDDEPSGSYRSESRNNSDNSRSYYTPSPRVPSDARPLVDHLRNLFARDFPPKLAKQMLTHVSAREAWEGHNARLSFLGRRVLQSYLLLFLHECVTRPSSLPSNSTNSNPAVLSPSTSFDLDLIAYRALKTDILGEYVGERWRLNDVTNWTPIFRGRSKEQGAEGLYKVMGTTVEGVVGGIFHQFGGKYTQQIFHTDVLPSILCPGSPYGLHDAFHAHALKIAEQMRGQAGKDSVNTADIRNEAKVEDSKEETEKKGGWLW